MQLFSDKLPAKFWRNVSTEPNTGCWLWTAGTNGIGYGIFHINGRKKLTHRLVMEAADDERDTDHKCRNTLCCNPDHLELVSHRENIRRSPVAPCAVNARKTHCPHGHAYTEENTIRYKSEPEKRHCRACYNAKFPKGRKYA